MRSLINALIVCLSISILSLSAGCSGGGDGGGGDDNGGGDGRKWTYMVYLGADNNLSTAGVKDISEMGEVGSDANVAIAVQAEFSPNYTDGIPDTTTYRLLVESGSANDNLNAAANIGNVDMGSPAALTDFIIWATSNYPADHYALILWDHGAGWKDRYTGAASSMFRGAIQDETSGSFMSLPDLAAAVRNAGVHIDLINFDACLMAMYEVVYEFDGLTDYLVFSEETEPGDGDPYNTILGDLTADPNMSAEALADVIVDRYDEFYVSFVQTYPDQLTTKSAVDMSQLGALDTAISALGQALMSDSNANTVAMAARTNTKHYAYPANHDLYDLARYINQNAPAGAANNAAADIMTAIGNMVTANATNPNAAESENVGLAIYLPIASETSAAELDEYSQLACNTAVRAAAAGSWGNFVEWEVQQEGGSTGSYGAAGYSLRVDWQTPSGGACDADLDLFVTENDEFYAPWMGQTTPNGHFSPDSLVSGVSSEYYQANELAQTGIYNFLIRYYDDGASCSQAMMTLYYNDSSIGSATLDLSYSYSGTNDAADCASETLMSDYLLCLDANYSDYTYLGYVDISPSVAVQLQQEAVDSDIPATKAIKQLNFIQKPGPRR